MSGIMHRRQVRKLFTPAEVFEECLMDIRDGLWVCGVLSKENSTCDHVEKPMGCALGLIGINTENCTWDIRRTEHSDFSIVETWLYEDPHDWTVLAQESMTILARAVLVINTGMLENYIESHDLYYYSDEGFDQGTPYTVEEVMAHFSGNTAEDAADLIVTYNDGEIGKTEAEAWFSKALELAQQK